jgi:heat shock protein HslJ
MRYRAIIVLTAAALAGCAGAPPEAQKPATEEPAREELPAQPAPAPAAPSFLIGMYAYMADAGTFVLCKDGARYPVAMEGDNAALERAYTATSHEPGAPVLVTLTGRIETRPPMEGAPRPHLVVDRFDAIWPEETCEKSGVDTPLRNTYWRLVELKGNPVQPHADQREVHLLLEHEELNARGFAGCNRFTGDFLVDGRMVRFGDLATTLLACPYLDFEKDFLATLAGVTNYRIFGETLVLLAGDEKVARFRAVYF